MVRLKNRLGSCSFHLFWGRDQNAYLNSCSNQMALWIKSPLWRMAVIYPAWDVTLHWVQQVSISVYSFPQTPPDKPSSWGCCSLSAASRHNAQRTFIYRWLQMTLMLVFCPVQHGRLDCNNILSHWDASVSTIQKVPLGYVEWSQAEHLSLQF